MIALSLKDLLEHGSLGGIRLGMARTQVQALVGEPDGVGGITSAEEPTPPIWFYGDLEFHYEPGEDRLFLVYMDHFKIPSGGRAIKLNPWIVKGARSRREVEQRLTEAGIKYRRAPEVTYDGVHIITAGNVLLSFLEEPTGGWPLGLYALAYSRDHRF